ncbi:hypothetical protein DL767_010693 [Monosporascus sp. MG133]|nr:hypothetical protein DL767_010693 [Monosporascus sp. MG133]
MASRALSGGVPACRRCHMSIMGSHRSLTRNGCAILSISHAAAAAAAGALSPLAWRRLLHSCRALSPVNLQLRTVGLLPGPNNSCLGRTVRRPLGPVPPRYRTTAGAASPAPRGIRKVIPIPIPALTPHENIYTVPNLLTFSRLAIAPFVGYAILHDAHAWALGLFIYAGISDLLDGWIARRWKLQTVVGSVVDPMADKTLMTVLTVSLATQGSLPPVIILGRDIGLAIAAVYYRWISLPPPKTFLRYWDFSLPSAEVRPTTISKYNTFLQLGLMGATMVNPLIAADASAAMTVLQYTVAVTTIWSGLSYVFRKDAVKILSETKNI